MTIQGDGHIFRRFDKEMHHLHGLVVQMGELAVEQLREALKTLENKDANQARQVIENDAKLNQLDVQADDEIIRIVAKRQPMAKDLREIIAVGKIVAELERAGDEARKIARLTIKFFEAADRPPSNEILSDIFSLSEYVLEMLTISIKAFDELDLEMAAKVLNKGSKLDHQLKSSLRSLSTYIIEDPGNVGHFVDIVLGIRALERFGGHARNIAGHIVFIKNGVDVRHAGVDTILQNIQGGQN